MPPATDPQTGRWQWLPPHVQHLGVPGGVVNTRGTVAFLAVHVRPPHCQGPLPISKSTTVEKGSPAIPFVRFSPARGVAHRVPTLASTHTRPPPPPPPQFTSISPYPCTGLQHTSSVLGSVACSWPGGGPLQRRCMRVLSTGWMGGCQGPHVCQIHTWH